MRFLAVYYEANGQCDKAKAILEDLVEGNPADAQSIKRLVAMYRDMQMNHLAIDILNKYLEVAQDDVEAWTELADIYLTKQNYAKAIHCYEEQLSQ